MAACSHPYTLVKKHGGWTTIICGVCKAIISTQKDK